MSELSKKKYAEGPNARETFENVMKGLFRAPKTDSPKAKDYAAFLWPRPCLALMQDIGTLASGFLRTLKLLTPS